MTDRKKQIEELSKEICNGCKTRHKCENNDGFCIMSDVVAEWLLSKGYRKMNDTVVVLKTPDITPEELERIKNTLWNDGAVSLPVVPETIDIEEIVGNTARDILNTLNRTPHEYHESKIKELAKQYGVEIEE